MTVHSQVENIDPKDYRFGSIRRKAREHRGSTVHEADPIRGMFGIHKGHEIAEGQFTMSGKI